VVVQDVTDPVITCPANITVNNDLGQCGAIVSFAATATDNCGMGSITYSHNPGTFFNIGTTVVTANALDAAGNSSACTFSVTVLDNENPTITCPGNATMNNTIGVCGSAYNYAVTSTDNCLGQTVVQTDGLPSGSVFPIGVTNNEFVVTDASGNTATCSFTVTVTQDPNTVVVYTILAEEDIHLHDTNVVHGNVGVWKAGKKVKLHHETDVYGFVKAPVIELNQNSTISGAQYLAQAPMPTAGSFRYNLLSSNVDVNVPDNYPGVYQIVGDNFDKIEIGKNSTAKFMNTGDIYIKELKVKGDKNNTTNINFNGNTNLMIKKKMDLDKRNNFNQVGSHTVNVYVEEGDVKVEEFSNVTANIDVRFKELKVKGKKDSVTTMSGQFIAKKVHGEHNVHWNGACQGPNNVGNKDALTEEIVTRIEGDFVTLLYPNPNKGEFNVEVQSNSTSHIRAAMYDMMGKKISDLIGIKAHTPYKVSQQLANGIYFIHIDIDGNRQTVKLIVQD
jgi:HYR domain/Secretion system C-terminal sorting domain